MAKISSIKKEEGEVLIFQHSGDGETKYQIQFVDEQDAWTVPVLLTKLRANRILNDLSIERVRLLIDNEIKEWIT